MRYIAEPLKRIQLRAIAHKLREITSFEYDLYFPIVEFLELVMPTLFDDFNYEIVSVREFPKNKHAETDVIKRVIKIRQDIYDGAVAGKGRDRMTVAHEIAHYILIVVYGVQFNRVFGNNPVITFQDPEWQAKALAGELLCPYHLINGMSVEEISFCCGVSMEAAKTHFSINKEGSSLTKNSMIQIIS